MPKEGSVYRHAPGQDFLSPAELKKLTPQSVIARMRALQPEFLKHAGQAEAQRRPVDHLWDEIRRSGYFYMLVPKKFGGLEASVDEIVDASLPIAQGCPSTGWVAMFGLVHNRHMVAFSPQCQEELFGGGRYVISASATIPVGKAVKVEGGYRLSGRWQWATCVTQADWVNVIAGGEADGKPFGGSFMIPADQVEIIDTWATDGMCATGTHDIIATDVFVPEHRANLVMRRDGGDKSAALYDNPIYRVPLSPLLAFTTTVPTVGCARGAVDLYRDRLMNHTKRGTEQREGDKQASQIRLAKADTMVRTAEILMRSAMKENLTGVDLVGDEQTAFRSKLRAQMTFAAQLSRQAVLTVCEATGTSIHYNSNPMQRLLRDIMVMTSHIIFDDDVVMEQHGRAMVGLAPNTQIN